MYLHIYTNVRTPTNKHIYALTCTHTDTYRHTYRCIYAYMHTDTQTHTYNQDHCWDCNQSPYFLSPSLPTRITINALMITSILCNYSKLLPRGPEATTLRKKSERQRHNRAMMLTVNGCNRLLSGNGRPGGGLGTESESRPSLLIARTPITFHCPGAFGASNQCWLD